MNDETTDAGMSYKTSSVSKKLRDLIRVNVSDCATKRDPPLVPLNIVVLVPAVFNPKIIPLVNSASDSIDTDSAIRCDDGLGLGESKITDVKP